jgi:hypothetical protein
MPMELNASYTCPHCGELVDTVVDPTGLRRQEYVEDCPVCCRPNLLSVEIDGAGEASVSAQPQ